MGNASPHTQCGQESRLAVMESALAGIKDNLSELKKLMVTVVQSQERIASLQHGHNEQQTLLKQLDERTRRLEHTSASLKWVERVTWILVTTGLAGLFSFLKLGGGK